MVAGQRKQNAEREWFRYAEMFSAMFMNELLKSFVGSQWRLAEVGIQDVEAEPFNLLPGMKSAQFFTGRPVTAISILMNGLTSRLLSRHLKRRQVKVFGERMISSVTH